MQRRKLFVQPASPRDLFTSWRGGQMAVRNLANIAALTLLFSLVGCDAYVDKSKYDASERQASQLSIATVSLY